MARANAVSRFLGERAQTKSSFRRDRILGLEIYTAGFTCTNTDDGAVRVEYFIDRHRERNVDPRADRAKALERYAELLRERFIVTEESDDEWRYLIVR